MDNKIVDTVSRSFEVELPQANTLDQYLDFIIPQIYQWGEDLGETKHYVAPGGKPWLEFRDSENFHEAVLHFFNEGGEYLQVVNGNISKGRWKLLGDTNKLIIEQGNRSELFILGFLSETFFILKKHGRGTYLVMGYEPRVAGLEWRDYVESLFNTYRENESNTKTTLIVIIVIVAIIVLFSVF